MRFVFKKKIIMKKTYMNPTMEVVKIQTQQMLAASNTLPLGDPGSATDAEARDLEFLLF